jgi:hypothetical protein
MENHNSQPVTKLRMHEHAICVIFAQNKRDPPIGWYFHSTNHVASSIHTLLISNANGMASGKLKYRL